MRVYLDTHVILDFLLDSRGVFHAPAVEVMRRAALGEFEVGFSTTQATDLYDSLSKAEDDETARGALRGLFALCDLLVTPAAACVGALDQKMDDYEDAVQALTCLHHGYDVMLTRNLHDYARSPVLAMDPVAFLERHAEGARQPIIGDSDCSP